MAISNLFNEAWYLSQNSDVAAAVARGEMTAQQHFDLYGKAEGRSPSPVFDTKFYLANNPDVAAAVSAGQTTAYDHFLNYGADEGRSPVSYFDEAFYLASNPDVAAAVATGHMTAIEHFVKYGQSEPRAINPFIDLGAYASANPDLAAAAEQGLNLLDHLLSYGIYEGRDLGNGINLGKFSNDPIFNAAVDIKDAFAAIERLGNLISEPAEPVDPEPIDPIVPEEPIIPVDPPAPIAPAFTVLADGNGVVEFGGTATGDITFTVSPDGQIFFMREGFTESLEIDQVSFLQDDTLTVKLSADALDLSVQNAGLLKDILDNPDSGFDANDKGYTINDTWVNIEPVVTGRLVAGADEATVNGVVNLNISIFNVLPDNINFGDGYIIHDEWDAIQPLIGNAVITQADEVHAFYDYDLIINKEDLDSVDTLKVNNSNVVLNKAIAEDLEDDIHKIQVDTHANITIKAAGGSLDIGAYAFNEVFNNHGVKADSSDTIIITADDIDATHTIATDADDIFIFTNQSDHNFTNIFNLRGNDKLNLLAIDGSDAGSFKTTAENNAAAVDEAGEWHWQKYVYQDNYTSIVSELTYWDAQAEASATVQLLGVSEVSADSNGMFYMYDIWAPQ